MTFHQLRKNAGMKQSDIARELGITVAAVSAWEQGKNRPCLDNLTALEKMLGVPLADIVRVFTESRQDDAER